MDVPGIVEESLGGEDLVDHVDLGGDDGLFVTPTRTLLYRSEGLLSDESVAAYDHDAEVLSTSEGRRKTRITLTYPIEGTEEFTLPSKAAAAAIPPILAGLLRANDVLEDGEAVVDTFLFSELTLVVTDRRLVKHIGEAIWDLEFEEYHFDATTGVGAEQGSVATQLLLYVDGGAERIKTPSDRAREVRETLEDALRSYHDLRPGEDLSTALGPDEPDEEETAEEADAAESAEASGNIDFGEGVDPLDAGDTRNIGEDQEIEGVGPSAAAESDPERSSGNDTRGGEPGGDDAEDRADAGRDTGGDAGGTAARAATGEAATADTAKEETDDDNARDAGARSAAAESGNAEGERPPQADDAFEAAGFEPAEEGVEALANEVAELRTAVQKQNKLLARQHKTIEKLVEELRRGR